MILRPKKGQMKGGEARVSKKSPKTTAKELKKTMLENLESRGLVEPVYKDMVERYMNLWELRRELSQDVNERGVTVIDSRGNRVENRNVSLDIQVGKEMRAIFADLGFRDLAQAATPGGGEEDEL